MAAATDAELIVLSDSVSAAIKAIRVTSNQYENSLAAIETVTAASISKRDAITTAKQNLIAAMSSLELAIKSRIV